MALHPVEETGKITRPGGYVVFPLDCYPWCILPVLGIYENAVTLLEPQTHRPNVWREFALKLYSDEDKKCLSV